jgi:hypothetical protein
MNSADPDPQATDEAQSSDGLIIRWRGRQEGPFPTSVIEQKLASNEIGLLHEVLHDGKWTTIRDYLAEREAQARAQRHATEEAERRAREAEEGRAREREESRRAAALAEERRTRELLDQNRAPRSGQASTLAPSASPTRPHRGGMILTFGLLGLFVCFPFGIAAWAMGSTDLGQMDAGLMDPSGRSMTASGRIIGMVVTLLWAAGFLILLFLLAGILPKI